MTQLLKLEYFGFLIVFSYLLLQALNFNWLVFILIFFTPDLGFLGYLISPRYGAIGYNFTHWMLTGVVLLILGYLTSMNIFYTLGFLNLAHANFDRFFGYGLKYLDNFNHTHLGWIGKDKNKELN